MKRPTLFRLLTACTLAVSFSLPARAEKTQRAPRVVTVSEVTIVGRVQKPIAAVDVSRIPARLTMDRQDQKLLAKIQKDLYRAPF
jgi:hypothetical protein